MPDRKKYQLAIDMGGTFIDIVIRSEGEVVHIDKYNNNTEDSVFEAIKSSLKSINVDLKDVDLIPLSLLTTPTA